MESIQRFGFISIYKGFCLRMKITCMPRFYYKQCMQDFEEVADIEDPNARKLSPLNVLL